jgi:hypothetical protein
VAGILNRGEHRRRVLIALLTTLVLVGSASAKEHKDHSSDYQAGTFAGTGYVDTGAVSDHAGGGLFGGGGVKTKNIGHNVAWIDVPTGRYAIDPPSSIGAAILLGDKVDPHKRWFVDQMHVGDKILFAVKCNDKHNDCRIWVPDPDKLGNEIATIGRFERLSAKTNTNGLCGKGKLSASVGAEVCNQPAAEPQQSTPAAEASRPEVAQPVAQPVAAAEPQPVQSVAAPSIVPVVAITPVAAIAIPVATPALREVSLGEAAKRNKQHAACLKLAADNPSIICQ